MLKLGKVVSYRCVCVREIETERKVSISGAPGTSASRVTFGVR